VDAPSSGDQTVRANCLFFFNVYEWGEELSEAYRTRATWNEWGFTAAGVTALAIVGSLTGLAAFGLAGSDAAKILPLAGGFVGGAAALWDNKARAAAYTVAANKIDTALAAAKDGLSSDTYRAKAGELQKAITSAKIELETKRSEFAGFEERLGKAEEALRKIPQQSGGAQPQENPE
jgi:hypothetical protein